MSLEEHYLEQPSAAEPQYTPKTEFDGSSGFIQTASLPANQVPDFTAILEQFGYDTTKVRIVGHPRTSRWQTYDERWLCSYRFHLAPIETIETTDLDALVRRARRTSKPACDGGHWFVFQAGDLQLGKRSRDGSTEQIIERYMQSLAAAKEKLTRGHRRLDIAGVQISMPGDCLEGVTSQKGANLWLTQETITEQTRILRRLMFETIQAFAPVTPKLYLDVVNGNHDESQRQQNTYPGDGWATECAIAVDDALKMNPGAFGHVEVRVPNQWSGSMTVPVGDSVVSVVHGHQFRDGQAFKWWAGQSVNMQPAGAAHVLQSGHYHSWAVASTEHKTHVQGSTFDAGSDWYRDKTGASARRGAVVYLLKAGEVSEMSVV